MASGAVSVISGGSAGTGLATALLLAAEGGRVAILGRRQHRLDQALASIQNAGASDAVAIRADATVDQQVAEAFTAIGARWGEVNALINAVGPEGAGKFEELDDECWRETFDRGVLTAVRCIRHALPLLRRAAWGRIVNLTAVSTRHQSPGLVAYTASKAALASVTKNLARSLAADGILVNAVAPGPILTGAIRAAVRAAGVDADDQQAAYRVLSRAYGASVDLQRVADPREIAAIVAFCASAANTYMTGAHLNVDGGSDF